MRRWAELDRTGQDRTNLDPLVFLLELPAEVLEFALHRGDLDPFLHN